MVRASIVLVLVVTAAIPLLAGPLPVPVVDPASGAERDLTHGDAALHVVFFATWCPPCVDELRQLDELRGRWERRGYRLVLIAVETRQSPERLVRFAEQRRPPGELVFDAGGRAAQALGARELPTHLVFDSKGELLLREASLTSEVAETIDRLLGDPSGDPP